MLRHLLRPLDATSIVLIALFALGLSLCTHLGLLGIVPAVLLLSWFFKYAYVLLDHVARGIDAAPVLAVEMLNPADEQRPLGQLLIGAAVYGLAGRFNEVVRLPIIIIALLLLPASVAVLGASGMLLQAANPILLIRVIRRLGWYYPAVLVLVAICAGLSYFVAVEPAWLVFKFAAAEFLLLCLFSFIGGAMYEARAALGLEVWYAPEKAAARDRARGHQLRERMLDEVYGSLRARQYALAQEPLKRWLAATDPQLLDVEAETLFERVLAWENAPAMAAVARCLIGALLLAHHGSVALKLFENMLARDPRFNLTREREVRELAQFAHNTGRPQLALRLAELAQALSSDSPG